MIHEEATFSSQSWYLAESAYRVDVVATTARRLAERLAAAAVFSMP